MPRLSFYIQNEEKNAHKSEELRFLCGDLIPAFIDQISSPKLLALADTNTIG